ncbi:MULTISPECIES: hypothetical protein [unclassified Campylobacter]|uniref:hypothetical protein n=1 Tax=unclassified Campylobacter TaxID=2593542 RepID=UPI003D357903
MSKRDTSLEKIDLVKLLLFILAFIIICFIMIFGFIIPNIKEYRKLTQQNSSVMSAYSKVKRIHDEKSKELEGLKEENVFIIKSYDTMFDQTKFIQFASKFFDNVKLTPIPDASSAHEFFLYELSVVTSIKTPQKFYDFLEALKQYESIIKAEFPIQMKGEGEKILTTFNIKVYGQKK